MHVEGAPWQCQPSSNLPQKHLRYGAWAEHASRRDLIEQTVREKLTRLRDCYFYHRSLHPCRHVHHDSLHVDSMWGRSSI